MNSSVLSARPATRSTKATVVSDFRRAQILEAARRIFARHGLEGATVDHIARAARVAKGTIYLYFRSKDEILKHAVHEDLDALGRETIPGVAGPGPLEDRLRAFLGGMLTFFDAQRGFIDLCQMEVGPEMRRRIRHEVGEVYAAQTRAWQAALVEAVRTGAVRAIDPQHTALAIVSFAHGLAIQRLRGWTDASLEADIAQASALLWKGLARS
ncbi:MAG TPA: TetR/AcrR family transcriptional regulator [Vicinamibacterales bacterium]